ncbi:MAG: CPBP family intramembrane metalloprotease [Planctomycetes bacterium]|nr:CPBP family intramembrane metalloprotease [Planctomycetota bacterium]
MTRCHVCRAEMAASARFCGACGTPTRAHQKRVIAADRGERRHNLRAALVLAVACTVPLFGLVAVAFGFELDDDRWSDLALAWSPIVVAAVVGALIGGRPADTFPARPAWRWLPAAVPAAALSLAASVGFVALFRDGAAHGRTPGAAALVSLVVLAPLLEEWLCRGVAWRAAAAMSSPRAALLLTAILFAFLHGLQGHMLALPHRFVAGLVFGALRLGSRSLWPGILAHALHNAAAVYWLGD